MAGTITAANAVLMLGVASLFPTPQQIQGFAADDVFDTEDLETAELSMGVDGRLSAGFVFNPVKQGFILQADSASNDFFESIFTAERTARDKFSLNGSVLLPAIGKNYTMTNGILSGYKPIADAKKFLQPRKFMITWESVLPSPQ